jgi:hypothetical protein
LLLSLLPLHGVVCCCCSCCYFCCSLIAPLIDCHPGLCSCFSCIHHLLRLPFWLTFEHTRAPWGSRWYNTGHPPARHLSLSSLSWLSIWSLERVFVSGFGMLVRILSDYRLLGRSADKKL